MNTLAIAVKDHKRRSTAPGYARARQATLQVNAVE
jgi:hypothetical protein